MIVLWLSLAFGVCGMPAAPDAPFVERRLQASGVHLVIEVWVEAEDQVDWATGIFAALDATGQPGVLMLPLLDTPPAPYLELIDSLADTPHEVGIVLRRAQVPKDALTKPGPYRRQLKVYQGAGPVRVAAGPLGSKGPESILGKAGIRAMVDVDASSTAEPRMAGHLEGQPRINVVLPPGAYEGDCGPDPRVAPFTPLAADRVIKAILRSGAAADTTPIVRLALMGTGAASTDADVLKRWLSEVVIPAQVVVQTATSARHDALQGFRRSNSNAVVKERTHPGRLVPLNDVTAAAAALADLQTLPRLLPGELNPTETLLAFCLFLSDDNIDDTVRLRPLAGPVSEAPESSDPAPVDVEALRSTARQLVAALPKELPASLPVGNRTLSSGEFLTALASLIRGDEVVMSHAVAPPDPHARGLGWGLSD